MKVGILTPSSNMYPGIGFDFMEGLKGYLNNRDLQSKIDFAIESVGFGGLEKEVYTKAEKLLMVDGVDVLLAYIDLKVLDLLQPLIYASNKLVIIINPGANHLTNWAPQPNILHLTLLQSFCCWLTGALAASASTKKAATAATFYDCGYLHAAAMVKSFQKHGGEITYNYVNNNAYNDEFTIGDLTNYLLSNSDAKNILCQFDSVPSNLLYQHLNKSEAKLDTHLFVSPMMLHAKALGTRMEDYGFDIQGYQVWSEELNTKVNENFKQAIKDSTKKTPSIFTLLGWESGMVLAQTIEALDHTHFDGQALVEMLKESTFESPRGEMILDKDTHFFLSTPMKCSYEAGDKFLKTEYVHHYMEAWTEFISEPTTGAITGWTNTYLCY